MSNKTWTPETWETHQKKFAESKAVDKAAVKFDGDKVRYELIPPEFLHGTADVLTFGAKKYEARNWEKGMKWSRPFGALMRHMWAWWNPLVSDKDPESGMSHLHHAACCLAFLIAYEARQGDESKFDDRP